MQRERVTERLWKYWYFSIPFVEIFQLSCLNSRIESSPQQQQQQQQQQQHTEPKRYQLPLVQLSNYLKQSIHQVKLLLRY